MQLLVVVPHHKNSHKWRQVPISYEAPLALVRKLLWYISVGHGLLTNQTEERLLFVRANGKLFQEANHLTTWFKVLQKFHGCILGGGLGLPPNQLRHIFVTNLQDMHREQAKLALQQMAGGGVGASQAGMLPLPFSSAMAMGNSVEQWDKTYDRHFDRSCVDAAVACMPAFIARLQAT